jgi:chromosome segregation ATPase
VSLTAIAGHADSARRRQRVVKTLAEAVKAGEEISVSGIARRAGVDRAFLYRRRDLLEQVHAAEAQLPATAGASSLVSRASLHADLVNAQERNGRLDARIRQLEKRLSQLLGEQAWRESGLGAPADIDALKRRISELEQQVADLAGQVEDRTDELQAARAANREMMTRLNTARRAPSGEGSSR